MSVEPENVLLIMLCSALADFVFLEYFLEEQTDFEEEVYNALFVAGAGASFGRIMRSEGFTATVAFSVVV